MSFEGRHGVEVQVVRGLVQDEEVAMSQHKPAEGHLGPLAAAERLDGLEDLVAFESEDGKGGTHFRLGHPRVHVVDLVEDRLGHGEVHLVLVEVPDRHPDTEPDAPDPFQDLPDERRLADAVLSTRPSPRHRTGRPGPVSGSA